MTLQRQLLTSRKNPLYISSDDPDVIAHFAEPSNYADTIIREINASNFYDYILKDAQSLTILDMGANIGLFSLYASDIARKIYAFEPTPRHYHILKTLTSSYSNIKAFQMAVGAVNDSIDFFVNSENSTMNSLQNVYGEKISVQSIRLKEILQLVGEHQIDFVKCDIEGSEMTAITDDTVGEVRDHVKVWYVECHATDHANWDWSIEQNRRTLATMFVRQGYQVHQLRRDVLYAQRD
jgi:FkbM family methyltransferase